MINKRYITQWFDQAPWPNLAQIEQDLIISRALIEIYNNEFLSNNLLFRGGTALTKLFLKKGLRYSEDIDLVQYKASPIGEVMSEIRKTLDPFLGKPQYKQSFGRVVFYYSFLTEAAPIKKMKLKIEINTREHNSVLPILEKEFAMQNGWFSGQTVIKTYALEELLGTKLRALYQRKKGRDLFDLQQVILQNPTLDLNKTVFCFLHYLRQEDLTVSRAEFEKNMYYKLKDNVFNDDIQPLLASQIKYTSQDAYELISQKVLSLLPGNSWVCETD